MTVAKKTNPPFSTKLATGRGWPVNNWEGQLQYNIETPDFLNADWTVGADFRQAISDSRNLTYGKNDADDDYVIYGGYLQGKLALMEQLDLVVAGRYDRFNFLDDGFFSPRVALVVKPSPKHTFRASFNRAANPATALETYVDFSRERPSTGRLRFLAFRSGSCAGLW